MFICLLGAGVVVEAAPWNWSGLESLGGSDALLAVERDLAGPDAASAARRVQALITQQPEALYPQADGRLISLWGWLDGLGAERRKVLGAACTEAYGTAALEALEALRAAGGARAEEFFALAQRYPLTLAATKAVVEAGDRLARQADFAGALAMYELALRQGWAPEAARKGPMELLRGLATGVYPPAPVEEGETGVARAGEKPKLTGPVVFDASWYGQPNMAFNGKFFPVTADDRIILASWKNVSMFRDNGQVLWTVPNPREPGGFLINRTDGYGPIFAPAVMHDLHGRPTVIVVRQPGTVGEAQYGLRAIWADGRTLWATESIQKKPDYSYAGLPAVAGGLVYGVGATRQNFSSVNLVLYCVEVMSGQTMWTCPLGTVATPGLPLDTAAIAFLSEPCISGDLVLVTPNCGAIVAVGRFDGKVRWTSTYRASARPGEDDTLAARPSRLLRDGMALTRFRSTPVVCGEAVVSMPQDSGAVMAHDRLTGRPLWRVDELDAQSLAGGGQGIVVVSAQGALLGLETVKGTPRWRVTPPTGSAMTGPAFVCGNVVMAAVTRGVWQVNLSDGKETAGLVMPNFRKFTLIEPGKALLREANAEKTFGAPVR